jgi:hypothetical protein
VRCERGEARPSASHPDRSGLRFQYWETSFGNVGVRGDGGLVADREERLESFRAEGEPDPAVPPAQLPHYAGWFPLAGGKSVYLAGSKLTRLNADGSVDTSFGATGTIDGALSETQAATELPSGGILLAGAGWGGIHTTYRWVSVEMVGAELLSSGGSTEPVALLHDGSRIYVAGVTHEGERLRLRSSPSNPAAR